MNCGSCMPCELGEPWTLWGHLYGDCPPSYTVGGWVSAGYHDHSNGMFNSVPGRLNLHQAWLYLEKPLDANAPGYDWGFRLDYTYGIDANNTQAFGNPPGSWDYLNGFDHGVYGWAIPQLYAEIGAADWSLKAGHFFTLVGYEAVTAPDNFFYSHAMTMFNSEPFTHTGLLYSRSWGENIEVFAGWTLGWDTGFDSFHGGSNWLGGFNLHLSEDVTFTYISTAGNFGARGKDGYSHSMVCNFTLTEKLNYILQSDNLRVASTGEDNVGINQYLLYTVSDCVGLGARMEWWKGDGITGFAPFDAVLPPGGSFSYYAATLGANLRATANVLVRPEVRFDWSPAAGYDKTTFGVDMIYTF